MTSFQRHERASTYQSATLTDLSCSSDQPEGQEYHYLPLRDRGLKTTGLPQLSIPRYATCPSAAVLAIAATRQDFMASQTGFAMEIKYESIVLP